MLTSVRPNGLEDTPQFKIDIDQEKAQALGVSINDINTTLGAAWGGSYVNDFIDRGRAKKVYVMSEVKYRTLPDDIGDWYVRAADGQMVPFSRSLSVGSTVRRVWNVTTACHPWKS
ncbi:efflux RND transporter permease subunit [Escherichia coli]